MGYYSQRAVDALYDKKASVALRSYELKQRFIARTFAQAKATEHARHGFCRRIGMLARNIESVFEILPPELEDIPTENTVSDATSAIHSFVLNSFGCLDNLAWIWVVERSVHDNNGQELPARRIGLGREYKAVRSSLSERYRKYLESRDGWFDHLKNFRDALAHRIPLYIPPFIVSSNHAEEYSRLDQDLYSALARGDIATCRRIEVEQRPYKLFRPWLTHSIHEGAKIVPFHRKLLVDFITIEEAATKFLEEL